MKNNVSSAIRNDGSHGAALTNVFEREMVMNCLQGNENAWEGFIRCYQRRIFGMSYRFTRCRAEAEDLTQDVFVRAYQTLSSYRTETGSLSGWIMRVARNMLVDRYRQARWRVRFNPIRETALSVEDPCAPNPLQCFAKKETATTVRTALRRLSPDCRDVIVLHHFERLPLCDVAAILHIPVGTVKSRMSRGRRELAQILRRPAGRKGLAAACPVNGTAG